MKKYILFGLFLFNFVFTYNVQKGIELELGVSCLAYYEEFHDFGDFWGWDYDGDGSLDCINYGDENGNLVSEGLQGNGNAASHNGDYSNDWGHLYDNTGSNSNNNSDDSDGWYQQQNGGGGNGNGGNIGNTESVTPVSNIQSDLKTVVDKLKNSFGSSITEVSKYTTVKTGNLGASDNLAEFKISINILFQKTNITITLKEGLNHIQQSLVLGHEFFHLKLLQITWKAGSATELAKTNQELLTNLNLSDNDPNAAHHSYMGNNMDEYEIYLRNAFPGEKNEFYIYGKWGGGAYNSDDFKTLSVDERMNILSYLHDNRLY